MNFPFFITVTIVNACINQPCRNNGTCVNVGLSFRCHCKTGYFGQNCEEGHLEKKSKYINLIVIIEIIILRIIFFFTKWRYSLKQYHYINTALQLKMYVYNNDKIMFLN